MSAYDPAFSALLDDLDGDIKDDRYFPKDAPFKRRLAYLRDKQAMYPWLKEAVDEYKERGE